MVALGQISALGPSPAMSRGRHVRARELLPGVATLVVPAIIVWRAGADVAALRAVVGVVLIALGLVLVVWTVSLFATVGRGTLAPWDPTSRLVARGPYRHVRNPMISGVACVLAGEATLLGSVPLLIWFGAFVAANAVYLPLVEEPGLRRRFGSDYDVYRTHVPRWLPRLRPWNP
jgi:protein-S-isoprenylcysteine O-methyltransferase Ste14